MECSIATLLACFSWSGLYIDADLSVLDTNIPRQEFHQERIEHPWGIETSGGWALNDRPSNPYSKVAIGYQLELKIVTISLEGWHLSSVKDNDRGMNAVSLRARWFPFR